MKVYIGRSVNFWGVYQISELLQKVGVSEDVCESIGDWLDEKTPISKICSWIDKRRKRKVKVKIHDYDCWNVDTTLAYIILPLLVKFKESETGSIFVDDEDVPEELRSNNVQETVSENSWDSNNQSRWIWLLDELIWTFTQIHVDTDWEDQYYSGTVDWGNSKFDSSNFKVDREGLNEHQKRITNGLRLFGKYYQGLWS